MQKKKNNQKNPKATKLSFTELYIYLKLCTFFSVDFCSFQFCCNQ